MAKNEAAPASFDEISERLGEIVEQVRDKETSLERSLDLFDEAIALGSAAVELVDAVDFSEEELASLEAAEAPAEEQAAEAAEDAPAEDAPAEDAPEAEGE